MRRQEGTRKRGQSGSNWAWTMMTVYFDMIYYTKKCKTIIYIYTHTPTFDHPCILKC